MNTTIFFILCAALTVLCRASEAPPSTDVAPPSTGVAPPSTGVAPPHPTGVAPPSTGVAPPHPTGVYLERKKALLVWDSDSDDDTSTVQYCIREDGPWLNVPGCVKTLKKECDFSAIATDLYGATLRVRSQRNNATSAWQQADKKVGCVHTNSCSPQVVVMASPGYLSVQMGSDHDQSLQDEYGGHLCYRVFYSREGESMKVFCKDCGPAVRVEPLSVGVRYCVKVQYLLYLKPYANTSTPVCQLIPQSEWERDVYLAGTLAAVFAVLGALSVGCYWFITHHHQDIKDYIRPVTLPTFLTEILPSDESGQSTVATPSESHDLISRIETRLQQEEEQEEAGACSDRAGSCDRCGGGQGMRGHENDAGSPLI